MSCARTTETTSSFNVHAHVVYSTTRCVMVHYTHTYIIHASVLLWSQHSWNDFSPLGSPFYTYWIIINNIFFPEIIKHLRRSRRSLLRVPSTAFSSAAAVTCWRETSTIGIRLICSRVGLSGGQRRWVMGSHPSLCMYYTVSHGRLLR